MVDPKPKDQNAVNRAIELVKTYAMQETIDPLRGVGRWLAFGAAGSLMWAIGLFLLLLSLLRALQFETDVFTGNWNWVPYVIVLLVCVAAMALAVSRIRKATLNKPVLPTDERRK